MSQNDVDKIKERLGIKEIVESYIKLEKAGKNFKGRCPFHNEKTPSFFVSPDRGNYYCFGCGAKGDIFTFIEQFEGTDFPGSLKILADKAGVEIKSYSKEVESGIKRMKDVLETSTVFFEFNLEKNLEALEYLKNRGLKEKTIKEWRVGFAPDGWNNILNHLKDKKYTDLEMEKTGMIKKGDRGTFYDTFRSRIMFPIFNNSGEPIAFSGRIFGPDDEIAKYLNSPETELFRKSEILYGFNKAKTSIRKNDFSILVEGQMDILMSHQAGYSNTVASSGTALTKQQLELISRISPKTVIAYDSDSAGFKASEKAWQMALGLGMDVKMALIPEGSDPADLIKKNPTEWKNAIKGSRHIIDVLVDKIDKEHTDKREIGKAVESEIVPYLEMIKSRIDKSHFVKVVSQKFGIPEEAIYADVESFNQEEPDTKAGDSVRAENVRSKDQFAIEKKLFGIIAWQESLEKAVIDIDIVRKGMEVIIGDEYRDVSKMFMGNLEEVIFTLENAYDDDKVIKKDVDELLINLELKYLTKQREGLLLSLRSFEKSEDEDEADKTLREISEISKRIQDINQKV